MLNLKLQYFGHLMWRANSFEKTLMLEKIEGRRRRGRQDEIAGWHHWLDGCEFGWTLEVGDGQGGLACCDSWDWRVGNDWATELNWTEKMMLWKCCIQYASKFGKLSSSHRTGKDQFSFQSQRKAKPKNAQTTAQLHSSHTLANNAQNYQRQTSTVLEMRTSRCSSWI